MNQLEQNILLSLLTSRLIRKRNQARKEVIQEQEEDFICTGQWINNVFRIEIEKGT